MGLTATLTPLETLFESPCLSASSLTSTLEELYGGPLGFLEPRVYANFVSSLDGVVALPSVPRTSKLISMGSEGDKFVMGLLRAFADVVLTGAGTVAAWPRASWMPDRAYPPAAREFAELRTGLGKSPRPEVAILTGRGSIDPRHPALEAGALVLTSEHGAARLEGRLPAASTIVSLGPRQELDPHSVIGALRSRGHRLILSEAGPTGFGSLVQAGLVDELFLTVAPVLAGDVADRYGLVGGVTFLPAQLVNAQLLSVRRQNAHLFLRYALESPAPPSPTAESQASQ
jgi:riboflavin biosynthesis pyrimidine reductase